MDLRPIRVERTLAGGSRKWGPVWVVLSLVLCCVAAATSATAVSGRVAVAGGERPELQRMLEGLVTGPRRIAPGVTAYVSGPHGTWTGAAGIANVRSGEPMRPGARLRLASVSKTWTATLALRLAREHRLSLNDTVERWLPGILPYGRSITVRQLLNHTAGVPDNQDITDFELYRGDRFRFWSPSELVGLVADRPQDFPAGTSFSYSNTGYQLVGMIVERVTGHRLGEEIERRIIRPLDLRRTSFPVNSPFLEGPHTSGYSLDYDDDLQPMPGTRLDMTTRNPSATWAAGNLVTNMNDLTRFFRALLGGRLLSPGLLAQMKTTVDTGWFPGSHYGLGLIVQDTPCGRLIGHGGTIPGYQNTMLNSEDGSKQFALLVPFSVASEELGDYKNEIESAMRAAVCPSAL